MFYTWESKKKRHKTLWRHATPFNNQASPKHQLSRSTQCLPTLPPSVPLRAFTMQQPINALRPITNNQSARRVSSPGSIKTTHPVWTIHSLSRLAAERIPEILLATTRDKNVLLGKSSRLASTSSRASSRSPLPIKASFVLPCFLDPLRNFRTHHSVCPAHYATTLESEASQKTRLPRLVPLRQEDRHRDRGEATRQAEPSSARTQATPGGPRTSALPRAGDTPCSA